MKKLRILLTILIISIIYICLSQNVVNADTVIQEMTDNTNYKYINYGIIASDPRITNRQVDTFSKGAYERLTNGQSQYLSSMNLAQSQKIYCVEPSRTFVAGPYSKGDGGVQAGTFDNQPELGWIYSSRIK